MLEKLSEIKNYYMRKRRKCFKVDPQKYRETIQMFLENRQEILDEVFEAVFDDFGIEKEDFETSLQVHCDDEEIMEEM